ncbi:alpha/beta fold hydrolase [Roseococcus sp.]|uniref:alpha/beta fold hydrolase n=1 Tax=Roseococcus sp. TaxID=2109646 RepID=UPI003BA93428
MAIPSSSLHAAICDRRMWHAQMEGVGARNQAIAYDRRGFGETRADEEAFSDVADLMAVMGAVTGGTPAVLVACSAGGRIALDAALLHPSLIRGLVLISPSVSGAPEAEYPPQSRPSWLS